MDSAPVKRRRPNPNPGTIVHPGRLAELPNRRSTLKAIGHAGLAAMLAPGLSLLRSDHARAQPEPLIQPLEIRSRNGVLSATLTAAPSPMQLGEVEFPGFLYNNSYLPPLLRIGLGDVMRIRLQNELPDGFSNLHFHGMSVSPRGRSDNVFVHVLPGHEFEYEVKVPNAGRQGPGLFWYHPHGHGAVTKQMPSRWECCHPHPSQTRTCGIPASGSSRKRFARDGVFVNDPGLWQRMAVEERV
jgi:hypothetical protein